MAEICQKMNTDPGFLTPVFPLLRNQTMMKPNGKEQEFDMLAPLRCLLIGIAILYGAGCKKRDPFESSFGVPRPICLADGQELLIEKWDSTIYHYYGKFPSDTECFEKLCSTLKLYRAQRPYIMDRLAEALWWDPPQKEMLFNFNETFYSGFSDGDELAGVALGVIARYSNGYTYLEKTGHR